MKKKPSESKKSSAPAARHQNAEKQDRAQKRLVTQNDLDELAGQESQQPQGQAIESESDKECQ